MSFDEEYRGEHDECAHEIAALRSQLAEVAAQLEAERAENKRVRELMTDGGGDQLQALADCLTPGVRALVGVFRLYRRRLDEARKLLGVLVYWHDHSEHIDESWWQEARKLVAT